MYSKWEMNFGIEFSFFYVEEPNFDLIRISCGHQPYDLSLTWRQYPFPNASPFPTFYQTKYQNGPAPYFLINLFVCFYSVFNLIYLIFILS